MHIAFLYFCLCVCALCSLCAHVPPFGRDTYCDHDCVDTCVNVQNVYVCNSGCVGLSGYHMVVSVGRGELI